MSQEYGAEIRVRGCTVLDQECEAEYGADSKVSTGLNQEHGG